MPGATDDHPLNGGLRIGKHDDFGSDSDGQYFRYLTVWMFALNRMSLVTNDKWYNEQAVSLAKAVLPHFMTNTSAARPRMYWKLSTDLSHSLVESEGNLDPIDGYVTYKLLQGTSGDPECLQDEIALLKKIVDTKWRDYSSRDTLDLGMTLWTAHWLASEEEWAATLSRRYALSQNTRSPRAIRRVDSTEICIPRVWHGTRCTCCTPDIKRDKQQQRACRDPRPAKPDLQNLGRRRSFARAHKTAAGAYGGVDAHYCGYGRVCTYTRDDVSTVRF